MSPSVDASPLGKLDAFKLALTDESPLELCEGPHHRQQQLRHRRIVAGERQVLVIKVDANSFGRQLLDNATEIIKVAGKPIHTVHDDDIAFTNEAQHGSSFGRSIGERTIGERTIERQSGEVTVSVLVSAADSDVSDPLPWHVECSAERVAVGS